MRVRSPHQRTQKKFGSSSCLLKPDAVYYPDTREIHLRHGHLHVPRKVESSLNGIRVQFNLGGRGARAGYAAPAAHPSRARGWPS